MPKQCIICDTQMQVRQGWLFKCPACNFLSAELPAGSGRGVEGLYELRRSNFKKICTRLGNHQKLDGKSILEVGCAEGWFLEEAAKHHMQIHALEPSKEDADLVLAKGFDVKNDFFPGPYTQEEQFDYVIFNDVFEHLPNPIQALEICETILKPGGFLILNIPCSTGIFYKIARICASLGWSSLLDRLWQKGFPSPHLFYYNSKTLARFIKRYSSLQQHDEFSVPSLSQSGLSKRLKASYSGFWLKTMTCILYLAIPLLNFLPSDSKVFSFKKPV